VIRNILRWLFSRSSSNLGPLGIILWWEARRVPYNLIIGIFGCFSLILFFLFINASGHLKPGEDAVEPMALMLAPFAINLCYTAGWIVEVALWIIGKRDPRIGPFLFKTGTAFSLLAAAFPSILWGLIWFFGLFGINL
jgi:hypothetical protein